MRRLLNVAFFFLLFTVGSLMFYFSAHTAEAATKYWIGPAAGSFNDNANWSTISGGTNDTTAPGVSDVATFTSGDTDNANLDSTVNVSGINMVSGYTGTLTQSAGVDVTVGTGNFVVADGDFVGSTGLITDTGTFTLSGGDFTASSATSTFKSTFTRTSGTYTHNNGTTTIDASASLTMAATGVTFNNLMFTKNGASQNTITLSQAFTVAGNLTMQSGGTSNPVLVQSQSSLNPTITVSGNLLFPNTALVGYTFGSASAANNFTVSLAGNLIMSSTQVFTVYTTIVFAGTGDQTVTKTSGTLIASMSSTKASGTLTIPTYTGTISSDTITWTAGDMTMNDIYLGALIVSGGTWTATGSSTVSQAFTLSGGTFVASSATTTFKAAFTRTSGTYTHNNGTTTIDASASLTMAATGVTFNNLMFTKNGASQNTITLSQAFTVAGNLTMQSGGTSNPVLVQSQSSLNPTITVSGNLLFPNTALVGYTFGSASAANNFTVSLAGNLIMSSTQVFTVYTTIVFAGTGDQTVTKTSETLIA